ILGQPEPHNMQPPQSPPAATTNTATNTTPPAPSVTFTFDPVYTRNTATLADDGLPTFMQGAVAAGTPMVIGKVDLSNMPSGASISVSGDFTGSVARYNAATGATQTDAAAI